MTPNVSLPSFLSHASIASNILNDTEIRFGDGSNPLKRPKMRTEKSPNVAEVDLLIGQDQNGFNAGSFWMRRSYFSRFLLEMWVDPLFMNRDVPGREQDALFDLFLQHRIVREHTALMDLHWFNAYPLGGEGWGWREGDLAVHFAGCWVEHKCVEWFEGKWKQRITAESLPEGKERLEKAKAARGGEWPKFT
jgi:hypothetical protein